MPEVLDHSLLWREVVSRIRSDGFDHLANVWLPRVRVVGTEADRLVLEAGPRVVWWVERRCAARLGELVRELSDLRGIDLRELAGADAQEVRSR
jgi:hypothetical protein